MIKVKGTAISKLDKVKLFIRLNSEELSDIAYFIALVIVGIPLAFMIMLITK